MQKILYIFVLSFILISCGDTSNNRTNSLSTLIKPSFTYNIDFFRCNLNDNVSLFNLESFFSKNILKSLIKKEKELEELSKKNNIAEEKKTDNAFVSDFKNTISLSYLGPGPDDHYENYTQTNIQSLMKRCSEPTKV